MSFQVISKAFYWRAGYPSLYRWTPTHYSLFYRVSVTVFSFAGFEPRLKSEPRSQNLQVKFYRHGNNFFSTSKPSKINCGMLPLDLRNSHNWAAIWLECVVLAQTFANLQYQRLRLVWAFQPNKAVIVRCLTAEGSGAFPLSTGPAAVGAAAAAANFEEKNKKKRKKWNKKKKKKYGLNQVLHLD